MATGRMWWPRATLMERGEGDGGDICSCHICRVNRFTPARASGLVWASKESSSTSWNRDRGLGELAPDIRVSA